VIAVTASEAAMRAKNTRRKNVTTKQKSKEIVTHELKK
jgi:hypothetical protein